MPGWSLAWGNTLVLRPCCGLERTLRPGNQLKKPLGPLRKFCVPITVGATFTGIKVGTEELPIGLAPIDVMYWARATELAAIAVAVSSKHIILLRMRGPPRSSV